MKVTLDRKVMLILSTGLILFTLAGSMMGRVVAVEGPYSYLKLFNEALYLIVNNYVQPIQLDALMEGAYRGMLESLDPGNEYLTPGEYELAFRGESAGAADVGLALSKRRGYIIVITTFSRGPAGEAGIHSGDLILSIDGRSTRKMGPWEAGQVLRGKPGTKTVIVLSAPDGGRKTVTLLRRLIAPQLPAGALIAPDVGVVRIPSIHEGDAKRADQAIASLRSKGAQRLLLDLRGCVSDSLPEAVGLVSLFVAEGAVVTVTDRYEGDRSFRADGRKLAWDKPLAVLVDEGTARACEVVAASLRDTLSAPILGQRTWGIGTLQKLLPLRNGDGVILATGKFLSPAGKDWNGKGIEPDIAIEGNETDPGDPQRQKAIDYLRGVSQPVHRDAA